MGSQRDFFGNLLPLTETGQSITPAISLPAPDCQRNSARFSKIISSSQLALPQRFTSLREP